MIGIRYPSGFVLGIGSKTEALRYASSASVPTRLVRMQNGSWITDPTLPIPRPRMTATRTFPDHIRQPEHVS